MNRELSPSAAPPAEHALFRNCLAASLGLHACLWLVMMKIGLPDAALTSGVEIDLTQPAGTGPMRLGAPKRLDPQAKKGPALPAPEPLKPVDAAPTPAAAPPKDWVLPGPQTKELEKPAPPPTTPGGSVDGTGTAAKTGGSGEGSDDGVPGGLGTGAGGTVSVLPRLLNRDDVLANLRRFYPEPERRAGREGRVVVALHIGADGQVSGIDVLQSAGSAFDKAAGEVAHLMRFAPARTTTGPVAVKIRQTMEFQLED